MRRFVFPSLAFLLAVSAPVQLGSDVLRSPRVRRGTASNWPKSLSDSYRSESHQEEVITGPRQWETSLLPACQAEAANKVQSFDWRRVHTYNWDESGSSVVGRSQRSFYCFNMMADVWKKTNLKQVNASNVMKLSIFWCKDSAASRTSIPKHSVCHIC